MVQRVVSVIVKLVKEGELIQESCQRSHLWTVESNQGIIYIVVLVTVCAIDQVLLVFPFEGVQGRTSSNFGWD